jgi:hypothetical protein
VCLHKVKRMNAKKRKLRIRCMCGKGFTPKRSNQRHCSPECRKASYERSDKAAARQERYNSTAKRKTVQTTYNRSAKGAVRRDRWQYSKAGRAWRVAWSAPEKRAARLRVEQEARQREQAMRESDLRQRMRLLAEESGVSVSEAVHNYLCTGWRSADTETYLRRWLSELRVAA